MELLVLLVVLAAIGCASNESSPNSLQPSSANAAANAISPADQAPPPDKTGGFDGKRAYDQVAKQVSFGPRPAGSPALAQLQEYLLTELQSYGCAVETDSFSADTPAGRLPMKNILVKIPGQKPGIILLGTHYDTKRLDNFVGADDAGSSTGVMLELARLLCKQPPEKYAIWIALFDGEEAVNREWKDPDNRYGSRQMAAKFAASGDLPKIKAFLLADIVGNPRLALRREANSTKWLAALVWQTADRLGYDSIFQAEEIGDVSDDHLSFLSRNVPSVDLIGDLGATTYWHTPQDTLDKISPHTLAIVGHAILESIHQLQQK